MCAICELCYTAMDAELDGNRGQNFPGLQDRQSVLGVEEPA
jgi:hypothetical protein